LADAASIGGHAFPRDQGSLLRDWRQRPRPFIHKRIRKIWHRSQIEKMRRRTLWKAILLAAIIISTGAWIWLLVAGIGWLIDF
jgi:hypothetical protein